MKFMVELTLNKIDGEGKRPDTDEMWEALQTELDAMEVWVDNWGWTIDSRAVAELPE